MSAKHTPGPWTITRAPDAYLWIEATPGVIVAETRFYRSGTPGNAEANAKLIAAAPTLADALEDALDFADEGWRNITEDRDRFDWGDVEHRRELIRAALRLAGRIP